MAIFRKYIVFLFCLFGFGSILAQNYDIEDQILRQFNYGVSASGNQFSVFQYGNDNQADLSQLTSRQYAIIKQIGLDNLIKAIQSGDSQIIQIYQRGDLNAVESLLHGSNIHSHISQYGDNNSLQQVVVGNDKRLDITQIGNDNDLVHIDRGSTLESYSITQVGTGMNLRVTMGNINNE